MAGNFSTYNGSEYNKWSWLIKTDINGNILWEKIIEGGDEYISTSSIDQTAEGGILLSGYIWSEYGNYDPYVMKLNACGEKEWCTIFASSTQTNPYAKDIKETSIGEIIVLVNNYGENNVEDMDLFKLNANGNLLWRKTYCSVSIFPEAYNPMGISLYITQQNNYYISGDVYWEDPWNPGGPKGIRPLFVRIDSIGNEIWVLPFGIQDTILGSAKQIIEIDENTFIGVGSFWPNQVDRKCLIMKFDTLGNELQYNIIDASVVDTTFIKGFFVNFQKIDSTYYFGGIMGSLLQGGNPVVEIKTDTNIFSNDLNISTYIKHDNTAEPYTLSKSFNKKLLSNPTLKEPGNWDIALSKLNLNLEYDTAYPGNYTYDSLCTPSPPQSGFIYLDDCNIITGIDIPTPEEYYAYLQTIPVTVYPNPANNRVNFALENTGHHKSITLKCFNLLGKQIFETTVITGQKETSAVVSAWPQGMYVAVVYSNGLPAGQCKFVVR